MHEVHSMRMIPSILRHALQSTFVDVQHALGLRMVAGP